MAPGHLGLELRFLPGGLRGDLESHFQGSGFRPEGEGQVLTRLQGPPGSDRNGVAILPLWLPHGAVCSCCCFPVESVVGRENVTVRKMRSEKAQEMNPFVKSHKYKPTADAAPTPSAKGTVLQRTPVLRRERAFHQPTDSEAQFPEITPQGLALAPTITLNLTLVLALNLTLILTLTIMLVLTLNLNLVLTLTLTLSLT